MRFLDVIDLVIGGDSSRVINERVGHLAQRFDLRRLQNIGEHDESVAPISGEGS